MSSNSSERIQMKLGRDTVLALQASKEILYGDKNAPIPNGYVISQALTKLGNVHENYDWKSLSRSNIPNVTDSKNITTTGVKTTLTLDQDSILKINELQQIFIKKFETNRIYRAFVVKMILYRFIVQSQK